MTTADTTEIVYTCAPDPMQDYDLGEALIAFEEEQMDDDEVITMFQYIYTSGAYLWLQGSYGRLMNVFLQAGLIS